MSWFHPTTKRIRWRAWGRPAYISIYLMRHPNNLLLIAGLYSIATYAAEPVVVGGGVIFEANIEYCNPPGDQSLSLNLARPKEGSGPFPAIVCIHGGGFRAGNREGYNGTILKLAQNGYVAVTVSYRLAPKYQFPAAVQDTKAAVRWVRANAKSYHVDPDRIGTTGGSAGGHLALFLGVTGDVKAFEGDQNPGPSS